MEDFIIPKTMKAMTLTAYDHLELARVPVPKPGPGEVLCRIKSVAICGSDPKMIHGGYKFANWPPYYPFIMGHEWAGQIVELGDVTLTPGLMNIHDHISRKSLRYPAPGKTFGECAANLMAHDPNYLILHSYNNMYHYLVNEGITYVRDQGLTGYTCIELRRAIEDGVIMGPYISTCGMSLSITGGHCYRQSIECDGADEVRKAVRIQITRGTEKSLVASPLKSWLGSPVESWLGPCKV